MAREVNHTLMALQAYEEAINRHLANAGHRDTLEGAYTEDS